MGLEEGPSADRGRWMVQSGFVLGLLVRSMILGFFDSGLQGIGVEIFPFGG